VTEVTLKRFKHYKNEGWVEDRFLSDEPFKLSHFSLEKLTSLLGLLTELDLASVNQRRIPIVEGNSAGIDPEFARKIKALLIQPDGQQIIEELVSSGLITSHDIVNIGYRKSQLEEFRRMLTDPQQMEAYAQREGVRTDQPEKGWQRFLSQNEWIFGFGLDYRFLGILQDEAEVGVSDIAGRDAPVADFLLGASNFTVIVEVKQPATPLFAGSRAFGLVAVVDGCNGLGLAGAPAKRQLADQGRDQRRGKFRPRRCANPPTHCRPEVHPNCWKRQRVLWQ
jgi:hypothetical protein